MSEIIIAGTKYEIIDTKSEITLADSFTKNKIGSAHGEAKLYVGMCNDNFFEDFSSDFFFLKQDFRNYLDETKSEFLSPKHNYKNVDISIDNIEFWKRKDGIFKDFVGFTGNIMQKSCTICDKLGKNYR